jgi:hypothetical protein
MHDLHCQDDTGGAFYAENRGIHFWSRLAPDDAAT